MGTGSPEGKGCGKERVWGRPQGWEREPGSLRAPEREAHTRHCLDAAIIVSAEHPGSAGSAERELNKELSEEESRRKAPVEPAPRLGGSFSAWRPPFVLHRDAPSGQGHVWVWGRESRVSCGGCILHWGS